MNELLASSRNVKSSRLGFGRFRQRYLWLAMIPFGIVLLIVAYRGIYQWQAAKANQAQIEQYAKAGVPYDNASMQKQYLERTHSEGYSDWARAIRLSDFGYGIINSFYQIPIIGGEGDLPEVLIPDANVDQWADEALVASYLEEVQPVIDLVERASKHPTPVQFPMHFQGFNTLLPHIQSSRSIVRLLSLDCEYAYSQNDTARALRDLTLMQSTKAAFESNDFLVTSLVMNALRRIQLDSIRRTLTHCAWDHSQLESLRELLAAEDDISTPYREGIRAERAMALVSLKDLNLGEIFGLVGKENPMARGAIQPSDIQLLTKYYNELIDASDCSILDWKKRAEAIEQRVNTEDRNSIAGMLLPATAQVISAAIRTEQTRRWTLTAVALRQYHQQHETWPKQLSDLKTLGLEFDDYSNLTGEMFGYEVDGQTVYLWKGNEYAKEKNHISPTRPAVKEDSDQAKKEQLESYLLKMQSSLR